jgi:Pyruvate/2-oxoacid:ferredoxin oxidoreductase gamma subunit
MTIDAVGSNVMANVAALGILAGLTKVVEIKNLEKEVAAKAPRFIADL